MDILTGKAKQSAPYRLDPVPYGFAGNGGYPVNVARYNSSQFAHVTTATSAPFTPLLFGRVAGRSFFVIGNTTSFAPPLFFFGRGLLTPGNFFFVPSRPRFSRFGR